MHHFLLLLWFAPYAYSLASFEVDANWVASHKDKDGYTLIQVSRDCSDFQNNHIPGARCFGLKQCSEGVALKVAGFEAFEQCASGNGITTLNDTIIIYDDFGTPAAPRTTLSPRLAWLLDLYQHKGNWKILSGGFGAWMQLEYPIDAISTESHANHSGYTIGGLNRRVVRTYADMQRNYETEEFVVLDTRPLLHYTGEQENCGTKGHINGSLSFPTSRVMNLATLTYEDSETIRERLKEILKEKTDMPIVASCCRGVQASTVYMALTHILNRTDISVYDGSMSEWVAKGGLVATGLEVV